MFIHLEKHQISPAGPTLGIYYDQEFHEDAVDIEAAVPVTEAVPPGGRVEVRELPAIEEVACIVHEGRFDTLNATYGQLMSWIEANGYHMAGPIREVYVQWAGTDDSTNITEIQLPVERV